MKNNYLSTLIVFLGLIFLSLIFCPVSYAATRIYFDPSDQNVVKEKEFSADIAIDTKSSQTFGADVIINYTSDDLQVKSVFNGGFFSDFNFVNDPSGRLEFHAYFSINNQLVSGKGLLTRIMFVPKKDTGNSSVRLICGSKRPTTQIVNQFGDNILSCLDINSLTITYNPVPTVADPSPTPSPSPTQSIQTPTATISITPAFSINPTSPFEERSPSTISQNFPNRKRSGSSKDNQISQEPTIAQKAWPIILIIFLLSLAAVVFFVIRRRPVKE